MAEHKVVIYPTADERKALSSYGPVETRVFDNLEAAIAAATVILDQSQDPFLASVVADVSASTLEQYLEGRNFTARWLEKNPTSGCFSSRLMGADDWRKEGITTALELEDYLDVCTFSDVYKSVRGFRPKNIPSDPAERARILERIECD